MTIMMMQTKWKLNNIELFLKLLCCIFKVKKLETNSTKNKQECNKNKIAFFKGQLNFSQ